MHLPTKQGPLPLHTVVSAFLVPAFFVLSFFQVPGELDSEVETSQDFLVLILSSSRLDAPEYLGVLLSPFLRHLALGLDYFASICFTQFITEPTVRGSTFNVCNSKRQLLF